MIEGYCSKTDRCLSDDFLFDVYKKSKSVKQRVNNIKEHLSKNTRLTPKKCCSLATDIVLRYMIPSGVKASIRGKVFNDLIAKEIQIHLKHHPYLAFQRESFPDSLKHQTFLNELPDWYIMNTKTKKIIIGYNQIDLWSGGAQCNRAHKYLHNAMVYKTLQTKYNCKLVCMIAKKIPLTTTSKNPSKIHKILEEGINNNKLFYIKHLRHLILEIAQ